MRPSELGDLGGQRLKAIEAPQCDLGRHSAQGREQLPRPAPLEAHARPPRAAKRSP